MAARKQPPQRVKAHTDIVISEVRKGDLLAEVTRAFLHGGAPTALLSNLIKGVDAHLAECGVTEDINFLEGFRDELIRLRATWRKKEDEQYGS